MKTIQLLLIIGLTGLKYGHAQNFMIQATGSTDVCNSPVTLSVVSPVPGTIYHWQIQAYDCNFPAGIPLYYPDLINPATGPSVSVWRTGLYTCIIGMGPQYSNSIMVRHLPGDGTQPPGTIAASFMPAPENSSGGSVCVSAATL